MRHSHGNDTIADSNCDSHSYCHINPYRDRDVYSDSYCYFDTNRNINANPDGYCNGDGYTLPDLSRELTVNDGRVQLSGW